MKTMNENGKSLLEKIKTWSIIGLFLICFFSIMISSYRYKNLNEKYEKIVNEQIDYKHIIDSLMAINDKNEDIIFNLNNLEV